MTHGGHSDVDPQSAVEAGKKLAERAARYAVELYSGSDRGSVDLGAAAEQLIEAARSGPECFKCRKPITEFDEVRIVTVWVDGEPMDVWAHADHAAPDA